ncbi:alpha/beta fold hydrolase [Streptomyces sp. NPDC001941]|uniref:alpha/beta fold hydrolase n=1 Tax=Streptomyces sp. NPDC001941 TaxID=3154659 RepID=UPI0033325AF3
MRVNRLSTVAVGISVAASLATPLASSAVAAPSAPGEGVKWTLCKDTAEDWSSDDTKSECAFVQVPVDYSKPEGRKINIAISRVKATGKRTGALFTNPGGPGLAGTPAPREWLDSHLGPLNDTRDFIGIDTRGTGYSAQISCESAEYKPGATEEEDFKTTADWQRACIAKDPELAVSMSMENAARDMDRVRQALGYEKIDFYGTSGGTALGAVYRSMFDNHVHRMWLESIMPPDVGSAAISALDEQHYAALKRFFAWLAERDSTYHFGGTAQEVESRLKDLRAAHGTKATDLLLDENLRNLPGVWERSAAKLAEVRDAGKKNASKKNAGKKNAGKKNGSKKADGPPTRAGRASYGFGKQGHNYGITNTAFLCNATAEGRDYADVLRHREDRRKKTPFSPDNGRDLEMIGCGGWPAGKHWDLKPGKSQLQLSGHEYEEVTPFPWAQQMQRKIGGTLLTVKDNVHSGIKHKTLACGSKVTDFYRDGTAARGSCPGQPAENTAGPIGNLAGTVKLDNCSASLVRPPGARDQDKALLLTNGHCYPGDRPEPGQVITDKATSMNATVMSAAGRELGQVTGERVLYATMTGTDMMLVRLDSSYADIQGKYGVKAFPLSSTGPAPGQDIKVASSYLESVWSCKAEAIVPTLREGDYTSTTAVRYAKDCDTKPGSSGSAVLDAKSGALIAVNSTSNRDGGTCTLNNPCEVGTKDTTDVKRTQGADDTTVHKGRGYATQTAAINDCITPGNVLDLDRKACKLPKP